MIFCKNLTDFDQISLKPYLTDFSPQPGVYVPLRALSLVVLVIGKAQFRRAMLSCDSSCFNSH